MSFWIGKYFISIMCDVKDWKRIEIEEKCKLMGERVIFLKRVKWKSTDPPPSILIISVADSIIVNP